LIAGKSPQEVHSLVLEWVTREVAQILCIDAGRILSGQSLHDLGMDSLMAVELALGLEQRFAIQMPVMMLNESPTADKVAARIVERLIGGESDAVSAEEADVEAVADIVKQHGEQLSNDDIQQMAQDARTLAQTGARLTA
jgi:acyl carrier protein